MRKNTSIGRSSHSQKLVRVSLISAASALLGSLLAGAEPSGLTAEYLVSRRVPAAEAADTQQPRDVAGQEREKRWRWKGGSGTTETLSPRPDLRAGDGRNRIRARPLD